MKDCPFKTHRCEKCSKMGHKAEYCNLLIAKTQDGKIILSMLNTEGRTKLTMFRDRTRQDKLMTATAVMNDLLAQVQVRHDRDRKKRQEKPTPQKRPRTGQAYLAELFSSRWSPREQAFQERRSLLLGTLAQDHGKSPRL
eukprot:GHVS01083458.1.p2 GENE.GHVS01083458.1~~GHVS01083458.1.p2  ORF type:complete len:140 (-),score=5.13 GHVS01083458.1:488-907(-)